MHSSLGNGPNEVHGGIALKGGFPLLFKFVSGLLCPFAMFNIHLEFVAGLEKLSLGAASNGAETGNQHPEKHQDQTGRKIGSTESKAVNRRREEIYKTKDREHDRQRGRSHTRIPGGKRDRKQEKRKYGVAKFIVLQEASVKGQSLQKQLRDRSVESGMGPSATTVSLAAVESRFQ